MGIPLISLPILNAGMIAGRTTWRLSERVHVRGETTVIYRAGGDVFSETPPCPSTCSPVPPSAPISLAGLSAHTIINDDYIAHGSTGGYYVLGGGVYRALNPSSVGSLGGAIEGGLGFVFGTGAGALSFEAKYVRIRHWIGGQTSLVPITLGFTW